MKTQKQTKQVNLFGNVTTAATSNLKFAASAIITIFVPFQT